MESTKYYDQFKLISSNRPIDKTHLRGLIAAIAINNMLHLNPIIVNSNMEVIEGQHRLHAAMELQVPIFYITDDAVSKSDIAALNSQKKNWAIADYINYWKVEGKPGFDILSDFIKENPLFGPSTTLMLLSFNGVRDHKGLRNGVVDVSNLDKANNVAKTIKYYRNYIDFAYDRLFVLAVAKMMRHKDYDFDNMKKKVEMQPRSLVRCISTQQYLEMLEEIYNYKSSTNRLTFK